MSDAKQKQLRVFLPPEQGDSFQRHKDVTERNLGAALSDSQFARVLITQALNTLDKTTEE